MADAQSAQEANNKAREAQARIKQLEDQTRFTTELVPPFSFTLRYLNAQINAWANETARSVITNFPSTTRPRSSHEPMFTQPQTNQVSVFLPDIPTNLFTNPYQGFVRFPGKGLWQIHTDIDDSSSSLQIDFTNFQGEKPASLKISVWKNDGNKPLDAIQIEYSAKIPVPDLSELKQEHKFVGYEGLIRQALDAVTQVQLVQAIQE